MSAAHPTLALSAGCLFAFGSALAGAGHEPCTDEEEGIPAVALEEVAAGFEDPLFLSAAGDGSGRLYVVEQTGTIRFLDEAAGAPGDLFLDIEPRVVAGGERGLLGLAFHPDYARNGRLFVNYTTRAGLLGGLLTRISEFKAEPRGGRADPDSERVLLEFEQPFSNHNGGMLAFGADGYLYASTGDGGAANDPHDAGQRVDTVLGKILRIDVDARSGELAYGVPADNPLVERAGARPEIYAWGLRNPWRFSIDPVTGRLYAGDVGQDSREEVSVVEKGGNYGWRVMEGSICTPGVSSECETDRYEPPIWEYDHRLGFSITGGYVYRGRRIPELCGVYVYGDYGSGSIWGLRYDGRRVLGQRLLTRTSLSISSFGEDESHELYVLDHAGGRVLRVKGP